jgi:hypothetical protein
MKKKAMTLTEIRNLIAQEDAENGEINVFGTITAAWGEAKRNDLEVYELYRDAETAENFAWYVIG